MFLAFLILDPNWPFCKGYSLCKMADFQNRLISRIFGFFFERFFAQNNSNVLVESFFACFWHFCFLTQSDHFARAIAFAWAIAFERWPIFKIVSFLEYLVFFRAVFRTEQLQFSCRMVFCMFLAFLIFDPNWPFCKGYSLCMCYSLCKMAVFQNCLICRIFGFFWAVFCTKQLYCFCRRVFRLFLALTKFLTQTKHFSRAIALGRWLIF